MGDLLWGVPAAAVVVVVAVAVAVVVVVAVGVAVAVEGLVWGRVPPPWPPMWRTQTLWTSATEPPCMASMMVLWGRTWRVGRSLPRTMPRGTFVCVCVFFGWYVECAVVRVGVWVCGRGWVDWQWRSFF